MNNQNHVVSLELCKDLEEAGYPCDNSSFYYHVPDKYVTFSEISEGKSYFSLNKYKKVGNFEVNIAAPTREELLKKLPAGVETDDFLLFSARFKAIIEFDIRSYQNALAKLWLSLKSKNLIE